MSHKNTGLRFSSDGLWIGISDGKAKIGITDGAQEEMGEVVYVQPPVPGRKVSKGDEIGAIESFKSVSPIISPVSGTVVSVNSLLEENPSLMNSDPYGEGWLAEIELDNAEELSELSETE
ncbi:MAG: glycine cleavage system protein H [Candidatus Methanomethylophilaceae archaeon]|jgi:glycine cleavage system H protein